MPASSGSNVPKTQNALPTPPQSSLKPHSSCRGTSESPAQAFDTLGGDYWNQKKNRNQAKNGFTTWCSKTKHAATRKHHKQKKEKEREEKKKKTKQKTKKRSRGICYRAGLTNPTPVI